MISLFHRPASLVGLSAILAVLLVQSGYLGDIDTVRRLQTTHSLWTSSPAVKEGDPFGVVGENGHIYVPYGIGQSLLMLPADMIGTYISRLPAVTRMGTSESIMREFIVSYSTSLLVCTVAILVCFRFLKQLSFTINQAIAGAFALLFGTTFLHYSQNMQENNFILLLTLAGFCFQYEWLRTGRTRSLFIGSLALGANLLTRLTTVMDIIAAALFVVLFLWFNDYRGRALVWRFAGYSVIAFPCYAVFLFIDRLYQFYRFGNFSSTYLAVWAQQQRRIVLTLPPTYPWNASLKVGALGPLFTPEKSIFLFDPLIIVTLLVAALAWKRLRPENKAWLQAILCLLVMNVLFHARLSFWSGDWAWGDRYLTTPVQLLGMISIPLLLLYRSELSKAAFSLCIVIAGISLIIQLSSIFFSLTLEIDHAQSLLRGGLQLDPWSHGFVIGQRFQNIIALVLGRTTARVNLFPFILWHSGRLRFAGALVAGWLMLLTALCYLLYSIYTKARNGDFATQPVSNSRPEAVNSISSEQHNRSER